MKPCAICNHGKSYHYKLECYDCGMNWNYNNPQKIEPHEFKLNSIEYLEKKHKAILVEEKHKKLNWCQICLNIRKSPFGICEACSMSLIHMNNFAKTMKEKVNV